MAFRKITNKFLRKPISILLNTNSTQIQPVQKTPYDNPATQEGHTSVKQAKLFSLFNERNVDDKGSECLRCLWPFLFFARLIGMCSVNKEGNELVAKRRNPYWFFTAVALVSQITMFANAVRTLLSKVEAAEKRSWGKDVNDIIYYLHTFGSCLFMILRVRQFPLFLTVCKDIEIMLKKYKKSDDKLVKHVWCIFAAMISVQNVGNCLYYYSVVEKSNTTSVAAFFKEFDYEFEESSGRQYSGLFFSFAELYCDLGWTFSDTLLALLSVILTRYFIRLNLVIKERGNLTTQILEETRSDHRDITRLIEIFSPLFLLNYIGNIGYLLTRLYTGLTEDFKDPTFWVKVETVYAFSYSVGKILFPTWLAAALHEKSSAALDLVHSWPSYIEETDNESSYRVLVIGRFVSQLVNNPIGISGCGYFIISKSFLVTLISALVTYEVVILQFQQSGIK